MVTLVCALLPQVADILEELYPDSAYAKLLLKDWEKQRRRDKQRALKVP